jgi:MFS family permease
MSYQPAENLTNRTFGGLIVAQFLAGFNDQAIHAAAMFYAMHTRILSQDNAITVMPILFYAPWAIFCTWAGYYADRYSKTLTLRLWKISEIVIASALTAGFYIGTNLAEPHIGGWIVMSCVFMMGTHAAFFAPAKYGAMPEILRPHILSRGNGVLESTTFLASILGTVSGGLLFNHFRGNEVWIGVILLVLAVIGAVASFLIAWLPAASPDRPFPINPIKPLVENLGVMFRSRPLALAVIGIAFFVFVVSYMRASMYMHGETRNPRWSEETTSLIVATVALGVGLGSPLAGYLSGGKVELGLVPLGCLGMIGALLISALAIEHTALLVVALIVIGFFSGFYMVPLYTLLQQRAPKKSKGELVATSNFINVTGAITATLLFKGLVLVGIYTSITPEVQVTDPAIIKGHLAVGTLAEDLRLDHHGKVVEVFLELKGGDVINFRAKGLPEDGFQALIERIGDNIDEEPKRRFIDFDDNFFDLNGAPQKGDEVIVSRYELHGARHFVIRKASQPLGKVYDNEKLPSYLFLGAAAMTMGILFLLWRKLPDFFVRSLFWFRSLGKIRLKTVGMQNLPTEGPVILATNCKDMIGCLEMVSATDRTTKVILIDDDKSLQDGVLLRTLAKRNNLIIVRPGVNNNGQASWLEAKMEALHTLANGHLLAISLEHAEYADAIAALVNELRQETGAPLMPVYCGSLDEGVTVVPQRIRVVFGEIVTPGLGIREATAIQAGGPSAIQTGPTPLATASMVEDCRRAIVALGVWIREHDDSAGTEAH